MITRILMALILAGCVNANHGRGNNCNKTIEYNGWTMTRDRCNNLITNVTTPNGQKLTGVDFNVFKRNPLMTDTIFFKWADCIDNSTELTQHVCEYLYFK